MKRTRRKATTTALDTVDDLIFDVGRLKGAYSHDVLSKASRREVLGELADARGDAIVARLISRLLLKLAIRRGDVTAADIEMHIRDPLEKGRAETQYYLEMQRELSKKLDAEMKALILAKRRSKRTV